MDNTKDLIIIHDGTAFGTADSFFSTPGPSGTDITWDGTNIISSDVAGLVGMIYIHSGKTDLITATFLSPVTTEGELVQGLGFDGTNLITGTSTEVVARIYKHYGTDAPVQESFLAPASDLWGVTDTGGASSR